MCNLKSISFLLIFIFMSCWACKNEEVVKRDLVPSFYHWKNTFQPTQEEISFLQQEKIERLYMKFLDIDWQQNEAVPVSITSFEKHQLPENIAIVPCVFITNRTILKLNEAKIDTLATRIVKKVNLQSNAFVQDFEELQIDCDWTQSSKVKYFSLLEKIKKQLEPHKKLSATIRLYQFAYPKETGIPPVDRGLLMCYNLTNPRSYSGKNSILDVTEAEQYLNKSNQPYALPLDVALPIFSWSIIFRNKSFLALLNNVGTREAATATFLKKEQNMYRVIKDTLIQNIYLRLGDELKVESVGEADLMQVSALCKAKLNDKKCHVAFFDLDKSTINHYNSSIFTRIYSSFKK